MRHLILFVAGIVYSAQLHAAPTPSALVTSSAVYTPAPRYPILAGLRGAHGGGIFVLHIQATTGRVQQVDVARTTGHKDLDAAAVSTLKLWCFRPGVLHPTRSLHPESKHALSADDVLVKVPVTFH